MNELLQVNHIAYPVEGGSMPSMNARVTINPYLLQTVVSTDIEVNGQKLKHVTIFYTDGGVLEFNMTSFDCLAVEDAVGCVQII